MLDEGKQCNEHPKISSSPLQRFRCGVGYIGEGGDHCAGGAVTIPVAVPGALLAANGCVAHRPRPLAQVASSATGGAPIAPPLEYPHTLRGRVACLGGFIDLCQSVKKGLS